MILLCDAYEMPSWVVAWSKLNAAVTTMCVAAPSPANTEKKKNFETLVAIMQHVCKNDACPKWIQIWDKVGFVMVSYH